MCSADIFDRPKSQQEVCEAESTESLFLVWDSICGYYDRGQITKIDLEEMKDLVWSRMSILKVLRSAAEQSFTERLAS